MTFTAHCFFRSSDWSRDDGRPSYAAVAIMLDEIEAAIRRVGGKPVAVRCETWPVPKERRSSWPDGCNLMAQISVDALPGDMRMPLRAWFQWQHPQWRFSALPRPAIEGAVTVIVAP